MPKVIQLMISKVSRKTYKWDVSIELDSKTLHNVLRKPEASQIKRHIGGLELRKKCEK